MKDKEGGLFMEKYTTPEMEVVVLEMKDVIMTSATEETFVPGENETTPMPLD